MRYEHPAIFAWRQLQPINAYPGRLEVVKEESLSTSIYKLACVGKDGTNVIAKRSRKSTAQIEHTIYEEILPNLPFPTLQYYGSLEEPNGEFWWLFIEDLSGNEKYRPHVQEHRIAAARWLGVFHTYVTKIPGEFHFPERKPEHYFDLLLTAQGIFQSNASNLSLSAEEHLLLEAILRHCEYLRSHWRQFANIDFALPPTLLHGDFVDHNVRIKTGKEGILVFPFDWEKAGWGIPAEDISNVDIKTYWITVYEHWSNLSFENLIRLANIGKIYRIIVFLEWIARKLAYHPIEQSVDDMRKCDVWLTDLINADK